MSGTDKSTDVKFRENYSSVDCGVQHVRLDGINHCADHRGSTGPAEPLLRTTATTNMAAANFVVKACNN